MRQLVDLKGQVGCGTAWRSGCRMRWSCWSWPRRGRWRHGRRRWPPTPSRSPARSNRMEFQLALSGPHDRGGAILSHPRGRGRHRGAGLGRDAAAHVPALGRAPRLQDRADRPHRRRRGRHQERHHRDRGRMGLRLSGLGAGRAPPGAHQPLRLRRPAATPPSPWWRCCRCWTTTSRSRSSPTTSRWTSSGPAAPAASTCRRTRPRCA